MKRAFIILLCAASLAGVRAQTGETHVSVRAGEERLESLLTESQKSSVTHLTVTGTLRDEDYAYLRGGLLVRLEELNLRDADIDTIPAHAFDADVGLGSPDKRIVLPLELEHLSDCSLCLDGAFAEFVLTGHYPTLGKNVYSRISGDGNNNVIIPSEDNMQCKLIGSALYSSDEEVLYRINEGWPAMQDGVRVINANACENRDVSCLVISATVDSVGDRAFAGAYMSFPVGAWPSPAFVCEAVMPPKLGADVFEGTGTFYEIYVPDGSVELYEAAEGWNKFQIIGMSLVGVDCPKTGGCGRVIAESDASGWRFLAAKEIREILFYDASGRMVYSETVNAKEVRVPKSSLWYPCTLVRVSYKDGTYEVLKLKP